MEQIGEALLGVAQRLGALLLGADIANHPEHLLPASVVNLQAAADFQPVQAAIGPADTVAQGAFARHAIEHGLEHLQDIAAIFFRDQFDIVDPGAHGATRVQTEQCLGAP
ncbi:hypothetical protein D9M68_847410 [compost metagenome]